MRRLGGSRWRLRRTRLSYGIGMCSLSTQSRAGRSTGELERLQRGSVESAGSVRKSAYRKLCESVLTGE